MFSGVFLRVSEVMELFGLWSVCLEFGVRGFFVNVSGMNLSKKVRVSFV